MRFFSMKGCAILALSSLGFLLSWKLPEAVWLTFIADLMILIFIFNDMKLLKNVDLITVGRNVSGIISIGEDENVSITIENNSPLDLFVEIHDEPPYNFDFKSASVKTKLLSKHRYTFTYKVKPVKRGAYEFGDIAVRFKTLIGMMVIHKSYAEKSSVKVYPNIRDVEKCRFLITNQKYSLSGARTTRFRGVSMEFDSMREYTIGDEPSRIDWKTTSRKAKLISREYRKEENQYIFIAIDHGRTMASRLDDLTKTDIAINAGSLLSYVAASFSDRVSVATFADEITGHIPFGKGRHQAKAVMNLLYPIEPRIVESDYVKACSFINSCTSRRTLVILFTDILDPDSSGRLIRSISALTRRHRVLVVALGDYELENITADFPQNEQELYEQLVASLILKDRNEALVKIRSLKALTLDARPKDLSIRVIERYMMMKERGWS